MQSLPVLLFLSVAASCGGMTPDVQSALDEQAAKFQAKLDQLESQFSDSLARLACSSDIRQMFEQVRTECSVAGFCGTTQIKAADSQLDPERRYQFFRTIRSNFTHEVVYVASNQSAITLELRRERLQKLAKQSRLRSTRFLIISSDHTGTLDARLRAKVVSDLLIAAEVPENIIDIWPYGFKITKPELALMRPIDKPQFGEQDLLLGIWVFRVDC